MQLSEIYPPIDGYYVVFSVDIFSFCPQVVITT